MLMHYAGYTNQIVDSPCAATTRNILRMRKMFLEYYNSAAPELRVRIVSRSPQFGDVSYYFTWVLPLRTLVGSLPPELGLNLEMLVTQRNRLQ